MVEQETASIIKFVLASTDNPTPYYGEVKENFAVPSCYFPPPVIDTDGDTANAYKQHFFWAIKFFHKTTAEAYQMAYVALTAIKKARNIIPLIDSEGNPTGKQLRLQDPSIKEVDAGAYQLVVEWDSRRAYTFPTTRASTDIHYSINKKIV